MICTHCGGLVTWRGPLIALTHTECESCGGKNCQIVEREQDDDEYENNVQAAAGGMTQTAIE